MIDEGYIKFRSEWQRTAALDLPEIEDLISWRRPLYAAGLIGHYADLGIGYGNVSVRAASPNTFIISGTQTGHLDELGPEHFSLVSGYDIDNNAVSCHGAAEASSETLTHAVIYELDPAIRAVVHVHDDELWVGLKGILPSTGDGVAYGTPQMAQEFYRLYRQTDFADKGVAVMAGHQSGLISMGSSLQEASERILSLRENFSA